MLEVLAHPVVLCREEGRVEDDAQRDGAVEEHVVDDEVEGVLESDPQVVVDAPLAAAGTVAVVGSLCNKKRETYQNCLYLSSQ